MSLALFVVVPVLAMTSSNGARFGGSFAGLYVWLRMRLTTGSYRALLWGLLTAAVIAYLMQIALAPFLFWTATDAVLELFQLGFVFGMYAGIAKAGVFASMQNVPREELAKARTSSRLKTSAVYGLVSTTGLVIAVYAAQVFLLGDSYPPLALVGVIYASCFIGVAIGSYLGQLLADLLQPGVVSFARAWPYLEAIAKPVIGFTLSYLGLILLFALYFELAWHWNSNSLVGLGTSPTFEEFVYFSVVTIATLGYGDIKPNSWVTRALASTEVVLGVIWLSVGIATVLASLQPIFNRIAVDQSGKSS